MTATLTGPSASAASEKRSRARRIIVAIATTITFATGPTAYLLPRHLDHQYGPVESGSTGGQYSARNLVYDKSGFSARMSTTPDASALMFETVDNEGSHSVTITSIPTNTIVSRVRWSVYSTSKSHSNLGDTAPWNAFPATVPAHGTIRLLVTINRPAECQGQPYGSGAQVLFNGQLDVHWKSLLGHHATSISYGGDGGIRVC